MFPHENAYTDNICPDQSSHLNCQTLRLLNVLVKSEGSDQTEWYFTIHMLNT